MRNRRISNKEPQNVEERKLERRSLHFAVLTSLFAIPWSIAHTYAIFRERLRFPSSGVLLFKARIQRVEVRVSDFTIHPQSIRHERIEEPATDRREQTRSPRPPTNPGAPPCRGPALTQTLTGSLSRIPIFPTARRSGPVGRPHAPTGRLPLFTAYLPAPSDFLADTAFGDG